MFRFYDEQEQSTFQAFQPVFTHMNTVFVAENILFKEDYWCRNCPLSTFVALGATETLGRLENTQSMKALLVLVRLWLQLTGTDVYRILHALACA